MVALFNSLQDQLPLFNHKLNQFLNALKVNINNYQVDHVGVRSQSQDITELLKQELIEKGGHTLSTVNIKNRTIYTLELPLEGSIIMQGQNVSLWELPHPAEGEECNGQIMWEHIEIVIPGDDLTLEGLETAFINEFPHLTEEFLSQRNIQKSSKIPSVDNDQLPNPTIKLTNSDGTETKFHLRSLKEVIGV